jgi:glycosyltransferase involved in cell wall biosynthesis
MDSASANLSGQGRERPLVSVIIPAFNSAAWIRESLKSVFDQSYDPIEVIVVDDGSTDGTAEIARRFDTRIKVFEQTRKGPAAARNLAASKASGSYFAFVDADDVWLPGKLQAQMEYFASNPTARIVYANHVFWEADEEGRFPDPSKLVGKPQTGIDRELSGWIYPELLIDSHIHIITAVIHRSVFDAVGGFDGSFAKGSDYDFWIRASRKFEAFRLSRAGALYRLHRAGITRRIDTVCAGYEILTRAVREYGLAGPDGREADVKRFRRRLSDLCFGHAYGHIWNGSPSIASRYFMRAIEYGNWRPKTLAYLLAAATLRILHLGPRG